jgi:hypothetical protein
VWSQLLASLGVRGTGRSLFASFSSEKEEYLPITQPDTGQSFTPV